MSERTNIYIQLKDDVGYDSNCAQYTELILRDFSERNGNILDNREELFLYAKKFNLVLNVKKPESIKNILATLYITRVHSTFERFLNLFVKQPGIPFDLSTKGDEDLLTFIVSKVFPNEKDTSHIKTLYYICNYYRFIRNKAIHRGNSVNNDQEIKKSLHNIVHFGNDLLKTRNYGNLEAPNNEGSLSFDDYILYSRALLELSKEIYKNTKYDFALILDYNEEIFGSWKKKYRLKPEKAKGKICHYLRMYYPVSYVNSKKGDIINYLSR